MKTRMLATAIAALFSTALFAQKMTYDAGKTTFGVRAGVNLANITGEDASGNDIDYSLRTGFHVGVNAEIPVGTGFYLQPGVLYSQKGAEYKNEAGGVLLNYIEVPVNFVYKPVLGTGRLLLGFGPYVGVGINGKQKLSDGSKSDVEFTTDYDPSDISRAQLRRIDAGGNLLAGYEFSNNISLQLNAQLGLMRLAPDVNGEDNPVNTKNTGFGISVGYRF